jgi:very-short-patch-repair endonuclease
MIIEVKVVQIERMSPRAAKTKRVIVYKCDQCGRVRESAYSTKLLNQRYMFCSYKCTGRAKRVDGVMYEYWLGQQDTHAKAQKARETVRLTHGVDHVFQVPAVKERSKQTWLKNYGVDHPMKASVIKAKIDWRRIAQIRHLTMKRNNTFKTSRVEDCCYRVLCDVFGIGCVSRQSVVNGWSIDFYVMSLGAYVQLDGVYWHGLDRPIEVIAKHRDDRDVVIEQTYRRDQEQNIWFSEMGLQLVRVTDREFKADPRSCLLRIVGNTDGKALHHAKGDELHL